MKTPLLVVDLVLEIWSKTPAFLAFLHQNNLGISKSSIDSSFDRQIYCLHILQCQIQSVMGNEFALYSRKWCETTHMNCRIRRDPTASAYLHIAALGIWRSWLQRRAAALVPPLRFPLLCSASWLCSTQVKKLLRITSRHTLLGDPSIASLGTQKPIMADQRSAPCSFLSQTSARESASMKESDLLELSTVTYSVFSGTENKTLMCI